MRTYFEWEFDDEKREKMNCWDEQGRFERDFFIDYFVFDIVKWNTE